MPGGVEEDVPELVGQLLPLHMFPPTPYTGWWNKNVTAPDDIVTCEACGRRTIAAFGTIVVVRDIAAIGTRRLLRNKTALFCRPCMALGRESQKKDDVSGLHLASIG